MPENPRKVFRLKDELRAAGYDNEHYLDEVRVLQPGRVRVGHCPKCGEVIVVMNNHEAWPMVRCNCGWEAPTSNWPGSIRLEAGHQVTYAPASGLPVKSVKDAYGGGRA